MNRKSCTFSEFKDIIGSVKLLLDGLSQLSKYISLNIDSLPDEEWNNHVRRFEVCYRQPIDTLIEDANHKLNSIRKRLRKVKRANKIRKLNNEIHKKLLNESKSTNQVRSQVWKENCDVQRNDLISDSSDAQLILSQIRQKKIGLSCLLNKLVSIRNYRNVLKSENVKRNIFGGSPADDCSFEANIDTLQQRVINQLIQNNREELYIKNLFNCTKQRTKKPNTDLNPAQSSTTDSKISATGWHKYSNTSLCAEIHSSEALLRTRRPNRVWDRYSLEQN